ncbi:MAG: hypothetical protein C4K60_08300 [Ideonella sp. MAG2]|nr:MAG: hypothetical protein C4K60_08300 [Ideonella sp. MAG2]
MLKSGIDQDALIQQFAQASAKGTAQLRKGVTDATLKALQGRELSLKNIRAVVKSVTQAASAGAAQNTNVDPEGLLNSAVAGMDDALIKAVEANKLALQRFVDQGMSLQQKPLQEALSNLEKIEDTMFAAIKKAAAGADTPMTGPWSQVMEQFQKAGSQSGLQATATVAQLTDQMQTTLRDSRAASLKAVQTLADSYTAMVSGVLLGLSDAFSQGGVAAAPAPAAKTSRAKK